MEIDALRIALLAVCAPDHALLHRIHGELEHWLNRQLATDEIETALAELAANDLVEILGCTQGGDWRRIGDAARLEFEQVAYLTTTEGQTIVGARWEEFFPQ